VTRPPLRILAHEADAINGLSAYCQQNNFEGIRWQQFFNKQGAPHSVCVFPEHADKGTALQYICSKLKIPLKQTLAIGDYDNDLSMFQVAGISISMGNALDTIKNAATHVAPTNEAEGVAWAVERFVLRE
jgi:hydroxymethylpyrimidine pyrophosphatase-like HAD family hydrolase